MENRFNLVDEPWIPITDYGRVSLRDIFSNEGYRRLGGHPVQKIAVFKLILAIAQAAATPVDEKEWKALGARDMAEACLIYLDKWHDRFYLYGVKPFLQMPAISLAKVQSFSALLPEVSTGNSTILTQSQLERELTHADKAMIILAQMNFALSGKKTDNSVVLSPGYAGKRNEKGRPSTGKPGPSVAHMGLLHNYVLAGSLIESVWLNLMSHQRLNSVGMFEGGLGTAPWELMPSGEDCEVAQQLKRTYMGRLISVSRFCLLTDEGVHYSEGIAHLGYKDGMYDLSVAVDSSSKEPRAQWADPGKRPWRELTSLLSFFSQSGSSGFQCWQVRVGVDRARDAVDLFCIWSGGLRVSSNAGEQYVSGTDDGVESEIWLESAAIGESWFDQLKEEMDGLDGLAKGLYGCVSSYFKDMKVDGKHIAAQSTNIFWQLCERNFQEMILSFGNDTVAQHAVQRLRRTFAGYQHLSFDYFCHYVTARQIDAWAKNRPNHYKYINQEAS